MGNSIEVPMNESNPEQIQRLENDQELWGNEQNGTYRGVPIMQGEIHIANIGVDILYPIQKFQKICMTDWMK